MECVFTYIKAAIEAHFILVSWNAFKLRGEMLFAGFVYVSDKKKEESAYWRCKKRKACSGRLSTLADTLWHQPSKHSHPPDPARVAVQRAVSAMKYRAENSEESTSNIIQNCTQDFPLAAAGSLPQKETLSRMISIICSTLINAQH